MSTKWVVTAAAERVVLGDQRQGEASFTVTNPGGAADRAVFDPVAGEGADPSWFSVDDPQRLVRGGASVSYLLKVAVPAEVPPGSYEVQGRVYSVDSAPEESSVLSPRVVLEVPAEPEPDQRKLPWPWLVVAGAVVLVLLVGIGVWVFGGDDDGSGTAAATPTPGATPSPSAELVMPDLLGMSEQEALATLDDLGLTVRPIKYRHDPERADQVVAQSLPADLPVSPQRLVDLEVAVALTVPEITAPEGVYIGGSFPTLEWAVGDSPARRWRVIWRRERCVLYDAHERGAWSGGCQFPGAEAVRIVDTTSYTPTATDLAFWEPYTPPGIAQSYHTGWVRWQVAALDDFGSPGPFTEGHYFRMPVDLSRLP
jgi:hypothetical protein